jgi:hypothetical protein
MANEQNSGDTEAFRQSGSGQEYDPNGNWAAERRRDNPSGGSVPDMEGAPSGAGDGGYGPEGDYSGAAGSANANVLGQVNADRTPLGDEAQRLGRPRQGRAATGGDGADEPVTEPRP